MKKLNEWIKKNDINFNLCQLAEKAMSNYCPNLYAPRIDSPSLFIDTIYNQIIKIFYCAKTSNSKNQNYLYEELAEYKNTSITILQFALCEYDIYSEFNQIIIALASCLICAKEKENDKQKIKGFYQNIISIIKILKIDLSLIEKCMSKIMINFNSEENNSDENSNDEESPKFKFQKENIIFLVNIIENNINNLKNKN